MGGGLYSVNRSVSTSFGRYEETMSMICPDIETYIHQQSLLLLGATATTVIDSSGWQT